MSDARRLPLPACGERVGVRGRIGEVGFGETPPHPPRECAATLSPRAGRGE